MRPDCHQDSAGYLEKMLVVAAAILVGVADRALVGKVRASFREHLRRATEGILLAFRICGDRQASRHASDRSLHSRRLVASAEPMAKREQPVHCHADNKKQNEGLHNLPSWHGHLSRIAVPMAEGTFTSRTGRSTSVGRAGASKPSVSKKPLRAMEFVHNVSRFPM